MKLTDLKLVDEGADREALQQLLEGFNQTAQPYDRGRNVAELFEDQARAHPERTAVVFEGRPFTYRQLSERSNQVARLVVGRGVVAVLLDNSYDMIAALLGIWKAGAIYLPINPELPLERTLLMLRDTGAELLLHEAKYVRQAQQLLWQCPRLATSLCMDSRDVRAEREVPNELMSEELWDYVGREATDDISGGGWVSSYTGERLSREVMDHYGENVLAKLSPLLSRHTRVLEIGCASGITLFRLAPRVGLYVGVDLSREILAKTEAERRRRGLDNVRLRCLPAHEIDRLGEPGDEALRPGERFDLIVLNSVVQSFHGQNYLYDVIGKCIGLLAETGTIFVGDVMDEDRKEDLIASLLAFKRANAGRGFLTKTDWSSELFLARGFWEDLRCDLPAVAGVSVSAKIAADQEVGSELSDFRYDVLLAVDRTRPAAGVESDRPRHRWVYGRDRLDEESPAPMPGAPGGEAPAYVLFTSGTTGKPKGVVVSHRSLHNYTQWACRHYFGEVPGNMALFTSPAFDLTLTSIVCPLLSGRTLFAFRHDDVDRLLARIFGVDEPIDTVKLTPGHVSVLRDLEISGTSVRAVIVGGEELTPEQVRILREINPLMRIYNEYGPTEATIGCTVSLVAAPPVVIGKPIDNTRVYVLDAAGEAKPLGVVGELCVSGDCLALGYWNDPALTAEKFVDHPFRPGERLYRTGDRAKWLPGGELLLLGRVDRQVKIRGNRIELGEIEDQLRRLPEVAAASVLDRLDRLDGGGDKCLCAYVVLREKGLAAAAARLREALALALPDFMIPSYFVLLDELPLSLNGKVDRQALPAPEEIVAAIAPGYEAPASDLERALAAIWQEVLGRERVGLDDNFFDLGGHSLKATQVVSRVHRKLGVRLALREIFRHPTLRGLVGALAAVAASPASASREDGADGANSADGAIVPIPDAERYELSHAQRRLWILHQIEEDPLAYNTLEALSLAGELDEEALLRAFRHLVARHESLRTRFVQEGGEPWQRVDFEPAFEILREDLSAEPDPAAAARERLLAQASRPFDLAAGPLLRVALLRLSSRQPRQTVLGLTLHHIISDGWSMGVLVREISQGYDAFSAGEEPALPPLRIQYRDYSAWQNRQVAAAAGHRAYWHGKLAGELQPLDLPTDFPRPPVKGFAGAQHEQVLGEELAAGLNRLARAEGASLFMVLVALVKTLLHRYTGQTDVVVGSPIAGRTHADLEEQIGFFANTLALRDEVAGDAPFAALLAGVRRTCLEAYEHQVYPFDRLVEELQPARDTSRTALFDVLVVLQNTAPVEPRLRGLELAPFATPAIASKFDLSFHFAEGEGGLRVGIEFATDLFAPERIRRLAAQLAVLAAGAVRDPARRLLDLDLLPPAETMQVTAELARGAAAEIPDLVALFAARVAACPERTAVVCGERRLTFAELDRRAASLAARLAGHVAVGGLVGVLLPRSEQVLVSLLAILEAGAVYLPLDPGYPADRIAFMLADSGARVLIAGAESRRALPGFDGVWMDPAAIDGEVAPAPADPLSPPGSPGGLEQPGFPGTLAYAVYTSGSTGRPKGVACTRRCLANLVAWQERQMGPGLQMAQYAALSFDVSVQEMLLSVTSGGTLHVLDDESRLEPRRLLAFLREHAIELLTLPFSALNLLFADPQAIAGLAALRHVATSGEQLVLSREIRQVLVRRPDLRLHNQYGPSETHVVTSHTLGVELDNLTELPPIGRPIANSGAYLLDAALRPVPLGVDGELYLAGANLAEGYLGNPERTAEKFVPHPYGDGERLYRTGDLCRRSPGGEIDFLGRCDDQVKIRGFRIEPGEIEHALLQHPAIAAACVLAVREAGQGELVAYLVGDGEGALPGLSELRAHLGRSLPDYMLPGRFVPLPELPRTPSGKVDRRSLPRLAGAALRPDVLHVAAETELERQLAAIWQEVLHREPIGVEASFFDLGGHSLKATQVVAEVHRRLGIEVPLIQIFRTPTVRALATYLEEVDTYQDRHLRGAWVLLNRPSERKVFALPPILGYGIAFKDLAAHLPEHALYGLDFLEGGLEGEDRLDGYAEILDELQPAGPLVLFGYSAGGNLAFELAKHLAHRGRRVSDILLLDSFKLESGSFSTPEEIAAEIQANLDYFSHYVESHADFAMYLTNQTLKSLLVQKMASYLRCLRAIDNAGTIDADLHLIKSDDLENDAKRKLWGPATTGRLTFYQGEGPHTDMILPRHLEANGRLVREILDALWTAG